MEFPEIGSLLRLTELTPANLPELTERIQEFAQQPSETEPRHYEGYRMWPLPRFRPRWWPSLDRVLQTRRWRPDLAERPLRMGELGRLLQLAHGVCATGGRGPTPSAGGLNALELYVVHWGEPVAQETAGLDQDDEPFFRLQTTDSQNERWGREFWRLSAIACCRGFTRREIGRC